MAKDPAFLFYPGDWNLGTMHMTFLEKGCYIELLMLQFARGKFTEAQAKHMLNGSFDVAWATISEKFKKEGDFYWNERLQIEKEKRQNFTESRRSNGLGEKTFPEKPKKRKKHMLGHMDKHMENENKDINNIKKGKDFNTKPKSEDFNGLPESYIGKSIELMKFTKKIDITNEQVNGMWEVFKIQSLTGDEYYANEGKVYSHFLNWIKKQDFKADLNDEDAVMKNMTKHEKEVYLKRKNYKPMAQ